MKKDEYLNILAARLSVLPADECRDIMEYYKEYFEEAGEENEEEVIGELGDVEALAQRILSENGIELNNTNAQLYDNKNETYYDNAQLYNGVNQPYNHYNQTYSNGNGTYNQYNAPQYDNFGQPIPPKKEGLSTGWKVLIAVITAPFWIGIVGGIFGCIFGFGVGALACFTTGIAIIISGISTIALGFGTGLIFVGAGFIVLAVALGLLMASIGLAHLVGKAISAIFGNKNKSYNYMG